MILMPPKASHKDSNLIPSGSLRPGGFLCAIIKIMSNSEFRFKLKGKTVVFIDWANIYGWTKSLKKEVDPKEVI
ncbi:MAG: hypothetical protein HYU80_02750 [Candidatus Blackburnbacteria bacterium]|nr:hypothetical protein [Candidatus Blackburnbacteria bacterium]